MALKLTGGCGADSVTSTGLRQTVRWTRLCWNLLRGLDTFNNGNICDWCIVFTPFNTSGARGLGRNDLLGQRQETRSEQHGIVNFSLASQFP